MKKVFLTMFAISALTLTSCNNSTKKATSEVDTTAVANDATNTTDDLLTKLQDQIKSKDANAIQESLTAIQAKYAELLKSGKLEEAKAYLAKAQSFIQEHSEQITTITGGNETIKSLVNGINNIPTNTEEVVDKVKESLQNSAEETKNAATEKVNDAAAKVNDAASKANEKASEAAAKVNEKASNAAAKAVKGLGL